MECRCIQVHPGESVEHGGAVWAWSRRLGVPVERFLDFSASLNPLGMPSRVQEALAAALPLVVHYPDPACQALREALACRHGLEPEAILVGNGATELIHLLPRALGWRRVLVPVPTFGEYEVAVVQAGGRLTWVFLEPEDHFTLQVESLIPRLREGIDAVILCNPNNPTGRVLEREALLALVAAAEALGVWVLVDEAFVDWEEGWSVIQEAPRHSYLWVLRSLTKFYALPGLRVGYLVGAPDEIRRLAQGLPPWSVNTLAQIAAQAALQDQAFQKRSRSVLVPYRREAQTMLARIPGVRVWPSQANFFLIQLEATRYPPAWVVPALAREGILIREGASFRGLGPGWFRVAVRSPEDTQALVAALEALPQTLHPIQKSEGASVHGP